MSALTTALQEINEEASGIDHKVVLLQSQITILRARKETLRGAADGVTSIIATLKDTADFSTDSAINLDADVDGDQVMEFETAPDLDDTQEIN